MKSSQKSARHIRGFVIGYIKGLCIGEEYVHMDIIGNANGGTTVL